MKFRADKKERLDKYISDKFETIPRNKIKDFIKKNLIRVNNNIKKPSYKLEIGDLVSISDELFKKAEILPEKMDLKVVFENNDYAVIDKDENVIVHPAGPIVSGTLVNGIMERFKSLSDLGGENRLGIVHRLDKDTTGLIIIAKNNKAYLYFKNLFQERKVDKTYITIVHGNFDKKFGHIETYIDRNKYNRKKMAVSDEGRIAITTYEVLKEVEGYSLLEVKIKTGRTHQIRLHMQYINHPILGDSLYGNIKTKFNLKSQLLHCKKLSFTDMDGNYVTYQADVHETFKKYAKILNLEL
ncbi:MAG: RluA family pseudouridine synthase [Peptoniphilaceae bacterium]|nr:RluA family pseudouridine synthase [Peptoniphilaceae bacterium]MDY6019079.1 RluA family pseudouridine synthase [Anaerococcus sp.]